MKKPNLQSLENIDSFINIEHYELLKSTTPLTNEQLINLKVSFINLYAKAIYNNQPTNTRKYSKYVSKLTVECISLFMGLTSMAIQIHNRKEVLEKAKIGGDFIVNTIKDTQINRFNNNGKEITRKNGKKTIITRKSYFNDDIRCLRKYENLLKRLKSF
ncbi:MAG: hypothetical protein ACI8RP_001017 [Urechidicola sp.]|jgi:hypothetical protein|tara:strand:+ start:139 stop:615 length:477 start_codon:yes stop_codon:yes gene_type:complete